MRCPSCNAFTRVLDSRLIDDGVTIRRRRECLRGICKERVTTYERTDAAERLRIEEATRALRERIHEAMDACAS